MLNICIVFAQLERETIQKRVQDAWFCQWTVLHKSRQFDCSFCAPFLKRNGAADSFIIPSAAPQINLYLKKSRGLIARVVVYKLDRISRSILDFANMMALFQEYNVEFIHEVDVFLCWYLRNTS